MFLLTSYTLSLNLYNNDANFIHFLDSWSPTKQDCPMFIISVFFYHSLILKANQYLKKSFLVCFILITGLTSEKYDNTRISLL